MIKKFILYLGLILLAINLGNSNLLKFYLFAQQRIKIKLITPERKRICLPLMYKLENYISSFRNNISISILNEDGEFIVDVNGHIPRIPASNQKLLSSAFSLDKLGPYYTLNTSLKLLSDGSIYIEGSGDPDFEESQLTYLISKLKKRKDNIKAKIPIFISPIDSSYWWPNTWSFADRKEAYGAPVTKYSIASNSTSKALNDPTKYFIYSLNRSLKYNNLSNKYYIKTINNNYKPKYVSTIKTINSAPLYVLLSLVNSESHNFTSEVLFRHSVNSWSNELPNNKYAKWLNKQNFSSDSFIFADASGLSRRNKVTTYGLTQFLRRMKKHRYKEYYFSSFSLLGVRGSLSNVSSPFNLKGKILAKSGTLNDVKSISGLILGKGKIFSIIVNNMDDSLKYIIDILSIVDQEKSCT